MDSSWIHRWILHFLLSFHIWLSEFSSSKFVSFSLSNRHFSPGVSVGFECSIDWNWIIYFVLSFHIWLSEFFLIQLCNFHIEIDIFRSVSVEFGSSIDSTWIHRSILLFLLSFHIWLSEFFTLEFWNFANFLCEHFCSPQFHLNWVEFFTLFCHFEWMLFLNSNWILEK